MMTKKIEGFSENEKVRIEANNIREASFLLGKTMKEENRIILEKSWKNVSPEKKEEALGVARMKLDQIKEWSKKDIFVINGENRLSKFVEAFQGYCEGSNLSDVEGTFLQIDIDTGCQTLMVQDAITGTVGFLHSEEDGGPAFDPNHYAYKWVDMILPEKTVSFLAYPGLCTWGPAFGINETTKMIQSVDDLYIKKDFDTGAIWPGAMAFMVLDLGEIKLVKELVKNLGKMEGPKFVGGYAIHAAQSLVKPETVSVEFAHDKIKLIEPTKSGGRLIVAQANCPINEEVLVYSESAYPSDNVFWSNEDAELYVEMKERRKRVMLTGETVGNWPMSDSVKTIKQGLRLLADPRGDIYRRINKETGKYRYITTGLPSRVMNSHLSAWIASGDLSYYAGKLRPKPIEGCEYETEVDLNFRYSQKKIWEEATVEVEFFNKKTIRQRYPWLFLDKKLSIDLIYDFVDDDEENEREKAAGDDTTNTAKEIASSLEGLGHVVKMTPIKKETMREQLDGLNGEVVFNQVEEDVLGFEVLEYLESLNKVVTGVDSVGYKLSWDKIRTKDLLFEVGVSTPKFVVCKKGEEIKVGGLEFPLFVKAADDHGSLSINGKSMVRDVEELKSQVDWIKEEVDSPALIEEYIDGRELGVTVLGNGERRVLLPVKEVIFGKEFEGRPKIITYDSKWSANSLDWAGTMSMECPANLTQEEMQSVEEVVMKSCEVLGMRDYARFDIRLKNAVPYVVDYNANPAIGSKDASGLPAKRFGLNYPEFISAIVAVAMSRFE